MSLSRATDPRFDAFRYFGSNGGGTRGGWYWIFGIDYAGSTLLHLNNALIGMTLGGNAYSPFEDETWLGKSWRWLIETAIRGDLEHVYWHDTWKVSNPAVPVNFWDGIALMMAHGETQDARNICRWVWERKRELSEARRQFSGGNSYAWGPAYSMVDIGTTQVPAMSQVAPLVQFLDPPGVLFVRNTWSPHSSATKIRISTEQYHYVSHCDMKRGAISIEHYRDQVIGDSGQYDGFGSLHHRGWRTQTISASGVVLVDDRAVLPHKTTTASMTTELNGSGRLGDGKRC